MLKAFARIVITTEAEVRKQLNVFIVKEECMPRGNAKIAISVLITGIEGALRELLEKHLSLSTKVARIQKSK